jgi:AraC family transcriptional regulator, transcriptional activator FtrA
MIDSMHDKAANLRPGEAGPPGVAILVTDGVGLFELGVASDIFGTDITTDSGRPLYRRYICGATPHVTTDAGFRMEVPYGLEALAAAPTVVVLPTKDLDLLPDAVPTALRLARSRGQRVLSLCTGEFVLAAAGLLDGRAATTHWEECADLARRYPRVRVDPGVLYIDEGDVLTSAGSVASVDLCLHVVERDYGAEVAARVARDLVVPLYRSGGQAQYIEAPIHLPDSGDLFAETMNWLQAHLADTVTVADLAERSAMSPRTFARRFLASTGTTPLAWLTRERLRFAKRLLETTDAPVDLVARMSGFGSPDNLRKHFARTLRTTPQAYRRTFRAKSAA